MLNSYKPYRGRPTAIRVNGSPLGVMNAANTSITTNACLLYFLRKLFVRIPIFDRITASEGISKTTPIIRISQVNIDM